MSTPSQIIAKLKILETLYRHGKANDTISQTLDKIINLELADCQQTYQELEAEIQTFEQQYNMASAEFYQRFHSGELGDELDFIEWNAFYEMGTALQEQIKVLQSTDTLL
ncbi:hypothetical protein NEA10_13575 [Phormidium yuhuli AB48]|uniref:Uncharacterized protein n=1 Tax=Phormidium yuhuli AB48 TaxID=2940671 RepID=A0ABY5AM31_9CYAN|nr:hypothetical protein [Phormidium yuhuli]USR89887.1 hypothetical protein NEA10_13575 [Phormidium yuhuli AB48]